MTDQRIDPGTGVFILSSPGQDVIFDPAELAIGIHSAGHYQFAPVAFCDILPDGYPS